MSTAKTTAKIENLKPVEAAVAAHKETVEAVMKAGTDVATKHYENAMSMSKDQLEKFSGLMFKNVDEMASLNKDNLDAVVTSGTTVAKGFEALSKEMMAFAQSAMEENLATSKKLFGARNVQEVLDIQSELARTNFDRFLSNSAKMTEMSVQVANQALEPLQTRVTVTVEKFTKPIAA